jgi:hypothetical protein
MSVGPRSKSRENYITLFKPTFLVREFSLARAARTALSFGLEAGEVERETYM